VVDQVLKDFGRIDFLINGAAGNFLVQSEMLSEKGFKVVIDIVEATPNSKQIDDAMKDLKTRREIQEKIKMNEKAL